jgi:hypothetical protein
MDRAVPQPVKGGTLGTYIADSSIVDSMTRFITVHATQGVTLARNVGYKSIGHGFYLEDATEINNRLYSNVGISVRGALDDKFTNPRKVQGILDATIAQANQVLKPKDPYTSGSQIPLAPPYLSDVTDPTVFWIMNTWNDFQYNVAVGAGVCGACYWMHPAMVSGPSRYESWKGYASMQKAPGLAGATPILNFNGNSCTSAMFSIVTVGQTAQCNGAKFGKGNSSNDALISVLNPAPPATDDFPKENGNLRAKTTVCNDVNGDCSKAIPCTGQNAKEATCVASVINRYTTSFNWAETNFSALFLRGWWYLVQDSAITDVQNGGITFVSGGGYSRSDAAQGFWSVLKNSILAGNTQPNNSKGHPDNPAASNAGPFNPDSLNPAGDQACKYIDSHGASFCASAQHGIIFLNTGFANNQRLFNIYDGPAAEYNNIYSDIHITDLGTVDDCRGKSGGVNVDGFCATLG